jgi:hypothetical protein
MNACPLSCLQVILSTSLSAIGFVDTLPFSAAGFFSDSAIAADLLLLRPRRINSSTAAKGLQF